MSIKESFKKTKNGSQIPTGETQTIEIFKYFIIDSYNLKFEDFTIRINQYGKNLLDDDFYCVGSLSYDRGTFHWA